MQINERFAWSLTGFAPLVLLQILLFASGWDWFLLIIPIGWFCFQFVGLASARHNLTPRPHPECHVIDEERFDLVTPTILTLAPFLVPEVSWSFWTAWCAALLFITYARSKSSWTALEGNLFFAFMGYNYCHVHFRDRKYAAILLTRRSPGFIEKGETLYLRELFTDMYIEM